MNNPPNNPPIKTGFAPVYQLVSDFQFSEIASFAPNQGDDILRINVPSGNLKRKLYCWLYAQNSTSNYSAIGELSFWSQESARGVLPMAIGGGNWGRQSLVSVCTTNGSNVQDCIGVFISNPVNAQPNSIILQPFYIDGDFDCVRFSLKSSLNCTYVRVFLAMVSGT